MKVTITQAEADAGLAVFTVPTDDVAEKCPECLRPYAVELVTECEAVPLHGPLTSIDATAQCEACKGSRLVPVPGVWTVEWVPAEKVVRSLRFTGDEWHWCPDGLPLFLGHRLYDRLVTDGRMVGIARQEDR